MPNYGTPEGSTPKAEVPANIQEFNLIAGLILAQLYEAFPVMVPHLDRDGVALAMGVAPGSWASHKLASGRSFSDVLAHTISWLSSEGYIASSGAHPAERVYLTTKGLAALSAVPEGLSATVGTALIKVQKEGDRRDWSKVGDLIGGLIGGYQKTMMS